jgi:membrane-bound lytic murein transglycosylase D
VEEQIPMTRKHRACRRAVTLTASLVLALALAAGARAVPSPADGAVASPAAPSPAPSVWETSAPATAAPEPAQAPASAASANAAEFEEIQAPAVQPIDPLSPETRIDPDAGAGRADLWTRLRRGYAMPVLDNERVRKWEQYYAARPDYVMRMTERGSRYLFHVVEEVEKRGLPTELALLPFVESAFNPQAISVARASGMWQFIPSTGRHYKLRQNVFRDDRRDVLASTRAALDYLQTLYAQFGDWQLALAAYNWGEGSVQRAVARNQSRGLSVAYEDLSMPDETRNYVPKLQAMRNLIAQPQAFGIELPPLADHPYFLSVPIARDIDVALAARLAEVSVDEFRQLNPQMNRPVILAAGTPRVLLPFDNANAFVRNLAAHRGRLASWTAWIASRTVKTAVAARQFGMSEGQFREVNRIPPRMLVKAGSTLLVPRGPSKQGNVAGHIADNAVLALAPEPAPRRRASIRAGKGGTTVATVAKHYRMSAQQVALLNRVSVSATFNPGQSIVVMLPAKGARATPGRTAGKAAKRGSKRLSARRLASR